MMKKALLSLFAFSLLSIQLIAQNTQIDILVDKGNSLYDEGKYDDAIAEYKQALSIDSNALRPTYELGNTYIAVGKYDEALACADKIINKKDKYMEPAYTLKGNALDMMKQYDAAIEIYKEGIKKYPDSYLLYYNLAFTRYNGQQYKEAEYAAARSIELEPAHASTHLILAHVVYQQNQRVPALLSLYYFLMLEPNTNRSEDAINLMDDLIKQGVRKENDSQINISVSMPPNGQTNDFSSAELALSMSQALKLDSNNKSEQQQFIDNTKMLFDVLGKTKKHSDNIWWKFYVPFFSSLSNSGNLETFCYYIQLSRSEEIDTWLKSNPEKVEKLSKWLQDNVKK